MSFFAVRGGYDTIDDVNEVNDETKSDSINS